MPLGDITVHTATPISTVTDEEEPATWIEGEPDEDEEEGIPFDCFFMISIRRRAASYASGAREVELPLQRKIEHPTILYEAERDDGSLIEIVAEDEVLIFAEEILGPEAKRFQVEGDPIPLAAPGELIGWEARLKRVID